MTERLERIAREAEELARSRFRELEETAEHHTARILQAFRSHRVSEAMFAGSTGYGYDDLGRDTLDQIWAEVFGTEAALVRLGFVNGTHAITCAIFAPLRSGDVLLCATGMPYDTLWSALGVHDEKPGSLCSYGIETRSVELLSDGTPDLKGIREAAADPRVREVFFQRSRGYSARPALCVDQLDRAIAAVKEVNPTAACVVDNCYGEFTEGREPAGDLLTGSLIKNPGGGLAPMGGYVAGRSDLGFNRVLYQGLFLAPHTVAQALKTAVFAAALLEKLGYETFPAWNAQRSDIIQSIDFHDPEKLKRFCAGIQQASPVDSFVTPEPWDMPGYEAPVIMAAGTFIQGASIELSCDGPMLPPYRAYLQGGLTYESGKLGILMAAEKLEQQS